MSEENKAQSMNRITRESIEENNKLIAKVVDSAMGGILEKIEECARRGKWEADLGEVVNEGLSVECLSEVVERLRLLGFIVGRKCVINWYGL